jgi:prephenate dehydrogenase
VKNFEVGIIGGTGGIGKWFAEFFQRNGLVVHVSGRKSGMAVPELAERCAVVIVSVPIGATCDIIRAVGPRMKAESLLADLTSLKTEPVRAMMESSPSEVIGLHPLFGPDAPSLSGQNVVLCPARGKEWLPWLKEILSGNGARLVETSPEKHDGIMAAVQALTHLNTVAMGLVLGATGLSPEELDRFATPVFRTKLALIEKVFSKNPRLYAEIIALNPHSPKILDFYEEALSKLKEPVEAHDAGKLEQILQADP